MTVVVKLGGAPGNAWDGALDEVARTPDRIVVHGGSDAVDHLGEAMGRPMPYYTSPSGVVSRRCDPAQLEVVTLALAGGVQTEIVRGLGARGARAVGLSGVDGRLLIARRRKGVRAVEGGRVLHLTDDRSGAIEAVDASLLRLLLGAGIVPVVGPPAVTAEGEVVNVDADRAAAAVAGAVGAEALVLLTNVPGLLRAFPDPASRIPHVARDAVDEILPLAQGRMRKKVLAARDALADGVGRVVIAGSSGPDPVARALAGEGTVFA